MESKAEWYLPVSHAADLLGCNRLEIEHLLNSGLLSFIMMPDSKIKISEDSVSRLMRQNDADGLVH